MPDITDETEVPDTPVEDMEGAVAVKVVATGLVDDPDLVPVVGKPPRHINSTKHIGNRLYVAGEGPRGTAKIMFIATSLLEEEAATEMKTFYGRGSVPQKPRYMKGPPGSILKDTLLSCGIDMEHCYYTALCKWLLPKSRRTRPKKDDIEWGREALYNEIRDIQPDIIVTFGKPVFDLLCSGVKLKLTDITGGWFQADDFKCRVYPMDQVTKPVTNPEFVEKFRVDFLEVRRMYSAINGVVVPEVDRKYETIRTKAELQALVLRWKLAGHTLFSVDCEWHGRQHVDGQLRSIQACWAPGEAAYIRFMDSELNYAFDCTYEEAGAILGSMWNNPEVKYAGWHFAADAPWMATKLGLEWYDKCVFDGEFAQQCVDEYEDLGLERASIKFTDLGRYDIPLAIWIKANKAKFHTGEGYGYVPDDILIPYACADVDVVFRAMPFLLAELQRQNLLTYYYTIFLPFVTNIFTHFAMVGLPIDKTVLDELRELFSYARHELEVEFQRAIYTEAQNMLFRKMMKFNQLEGAKAYLRLHEFADKDNQNDRAFDVLKHLVGIEHLSEYQPFFDHYIASPEFNIRATPQMRRWLFEVKGYTPVKSTNNKEKGLPSIPWEKVQGLPEDRQKEYTPSVDRQSLQILAEDDTLVTQLLQLNATGNLCKAFLKEADIDPETGELVKENGLHFWIASDGRVHGQMSTTETGRPRSWKPNSLNWPSYVNDRIKDGIKRVLEQRKAEGGLPPQFHRYLQDEIPSIRSVVRAPAKWCLVESDFQTAEVRGLGFKSGDKDLIKLICEPDQNFIKTKDGGIARIGFTKTGIPEEQFADTIMAKIENGKIIGRLGMLDLVRKDNGAFVHPKADLHWALAEMVHKKPREYLSKKKDRDASAKIGRFSSTYGASGTTLERKIRADTGFKPEPGTGQKLLDALAEAQPVAEAWLKELERIPDDPGYWVAESGRIRHFRSHPAYAYGISARMRSGQMSAMGREMRNFPMQESVAATSARAGNALLKEYRRRGMQAQIITILYDSVVTLCPIEERFICAELHQRFMSDENKWHDHGVTWEYPIDTEIHWAWSWHPAGFKKPLQKDIDEQTLLDDTSWCSDPTWLADEYKLVA